MPSRRTRFRLLQLTAIAVFLASCGVVVLALTFPLSLAMIVLAIVLTTLFVWNPVIAVYGMALTYPYLNLELVVGSVNVPLVDVFGLSALIALCVRYAYARFVQNQSITRLRVPGVYAWLAFIGVAVLATQHAIVLSDSLKFVARPLIFFFVVFVVAVPLIIRSEQILRTTIVCMLITSVLVAIYGLCGLVIVGTPTLLERRVVPFDLFGYYPLGYNHNLIADVMVTSVPLMWYMWSTATDRLSRRIYLLGLVLLVVTGLLTFSRTAWLALIVEGVVLVRLSYAHMIRKFFPMITVFALVILPLVAYMFVFMQQAAVQSSNENRIMLFDIAMDMWTSYPVIGAGPGTFLSYVESNPIYMKEFGAPLDAHSVTYKVLSETGALGAIAFAVLCGQILWYIFQSVRDAALSPHQRYLLACLLTTCIGGFFFQLFQTSYFVSKLWFPVGVALACIAVYRQARSQRTMHI